MVSQPTSRVLMLAVSGYEDCELWGPREALLDSGAAVILASSQPGPIRGVVFDSGTQQGNSSDRDILPDAMLGEVEHKQFDALLLPGGEENSDQLRNNPHAVALVRAFMDAGKPVAAICHAPWLLAKADVLKGRRVTAWDSVRPDIAEAGAIVVDSEVVVDGNLITSRMPADVPAFSAALISALADRSRL
ncbi:MAG: peptidase [Mycobacterium sp.]|nr:peptidase [Mycobacterium sp.]